MTTVTPGTAPAGGWDVDSVATELLRCEDERVDRPPFTDEWPDLDLDTGYRVQDLTLERRLARGERLVGVKLGLTSKAKQERMGVRVPLVAWLTDAMVLQPGAPVPQSRLIHPRVEPEIVFVMGERLQGPGVTRDRRWPPWRRSPAGPRSSTAGSATSASPPVTSWPTTRRRARFVTGPVEREPTDLDLTAEEVQVEVDGTGSTRPRERPCWGTPERPSPSPPTCSASAGSRSSPAGSCSPAA